MDDLQQSLQEAFESNGYDVADVSRNRNQVRIVILEESPAAEEFRSITEDAVDADSLFGLNVTTESVDGHDGMQTVVSFRIRS